MDDDRAVEIAHRWVEDAQAPTCVTAFLIGAHKPYESSSACQSIGEQTDQQPWNPAVEDAEVRACYDAEVRLLDEQLTPLVRTAVERGWGVVVTSDHGESLGEPAGRGYGHGMELSVAENTGIYFSFGVREPSETVANNLDVSTVMLAAAGAEVAGPAPMVSVGCREGLTPQIGRYVLEQGQFEALTPAELTALGFQAPSCPEQGEARAFNDVPPTALEALQALGYISHTGHPR